MSNPRNPPSGPSRPRRNRRSAAIRELVREARLAPANLVYPLFVQEGEADEPIEAMPGQTRWSLAGLVEEVGRARSLGVRAFALFPKVPEELKSPDGAECSNPDGLVPRALAALREDPTVPLAWYAKMLFHKDGYRSHRAYTALIERTRIGAGPLHDKQGEVRRKFLDAYVARLRESGWLPKDFTPDR